MTQYLPQNLLALFAPRDPIPFLPPPDKLPHEKKTAGYTGIGQFVNLFEDPKDTPPPVRIETREERQERKRKEKAEQVAYKLEQDIALWDPANNPASTSDPYKTLFVARINYDSSESKLRREFEVYGPIRKIVLVHDNSSGKPRGYAFIEYEHERDMHSAYKHADGKKIDGRRVLVDVERGRIVKGWLPRRLGGGLGGTRRGGPDVNVKHSGREDSRLDGSYLDRERERGPGERERGGGGGGEREKRRSRSRDRDRKRRSRSRERHRDRSERGGRDRSMSAIEKVEEGLNGIPAEIKKRERRRSRSRDRSGRDRDRKRRRSRSKSRDRKRRDRDRDDRRDRGDKEDRRNHDGDDVVIKQEPIDEGYDRNEYGYPNNDNPDFANQTFKTDNDDDGYGGYNNDGYQN